MFRILTNKQQTIDLNQRYQNGELSYLHLASIEVLEENEYGLEPGNYIGYEYEERQNMKNLQTEQSLNEDFVISVDK